MTKSKNRTYFLKGKNISIGSFLIDFDIPCIPHYHYCIRTHSSYHLFLGFFRYFPGLTFTQLCASHLCLRDIEVSVLYDIHTSQSIFRHPMVFLVCLFLENMLFPIAGCCGSSRILKCVEFSMFYWQATNSQLSKQRHSKLQIISYLI